MTDEYTDITNKEKFSFCIRTVDDKLEVKEDLLGLYELEYECNKEYFVEV